MTKLETWRSQRTGVIVSITGRLGRDPELRVGENGETFICASLYVEDADDSVNWWTLFSANEGACRSLDKLRKGDRIWCFGQLSISSSLRDGKSIAFPRIEAQEIIASTGGRPLRRPRHP